MVKVLQQGLFLQNSFPTTMLQATENYIWQISFLVKLQMFADIGTSTLITSYFFFPFFSRLFYMSCSIAAVHCQRVLCKTAIIATQFFQLLIQWTCKSRHSLLKLVILFRRVFVKNNFLTLELGITYPVNKSALQINHVITNLDHLIRPVFGVINAGSS